MDNLIQFLRDLLASGQAGFVIIILLILIGIGMFIIWSQRQSLMRIELNMKAADTARQQLQNTIEKQYEIVVKTNDELRKELERYKSDQVKFESDVRKALTIGFDELKTSLTDITISDIVGQIPEKLRDELELEISQAAERAITNLTKRLKESETIKKELFSKKELEKVFREMSTQAVQSVIAELSNEFPDPRIDLMLRQTIHTALKELIDAHYYDDSQYFRRPPHEEMRPNLLLVPMSEDAMSYLAARIAENLENFNRRRGL